MSRDEPARGLVKVVQGGSRRRETESAWFSDRGWVMLRVAFAAVVAAVYYVAAVVGSSWYADDFLYLQVARRGRADALVVGRGQLRTLRAWHPAGVPVRPTSGRSRLPLRRDRPGGSQRRRRVRVDQPPGGDLGPPAPDHRPGRRRRPLGVHHARGPLVGRGRPRHGSPGLRAVVHVVLRRLSAHPAPALARGLVARPRDGAPGAGASPADHRLPRAAALRRPAPRTCLAGAGTAGVVRPAHVGRVRRDHRRVLGVPHVRLPVGTPTPGVSAPWSTSRSTASSTTSFPGRSVPASAGRESRTCRWCCPASCSCRSRPRSWRSR